MDDIGMRRALRWLGASVGVALMVFGATLVAITGASTGASAQTAVAVSSIPLGSLKTVPVQGPNLDQFVQDKTALVQLGKALFWDQQLGSDGKTACATCHFQAGADGRTKNSVNPGILAGDTTWQVGGPNYQLSAADFPFHKLADPSNNASAVVSDRNEVTGSQGVFLADFLLPGIKKSQDTCKQVRDTTFNVGGINTRRITGRNAPSAINAAYNFRNFWDGRANNTFNGLNPFGDRDPDQNDPTKAGIYKAGPNGTLTRTPISIPFSSLASQAVGPPDSPFEMACDGRVFQNIGRKMLLLTPLGQQQVSPTDSVLRPLVKDDKGLGISYPGLIMRAFRPEWWSSTQLVTLDGTSPALDRQLHSDLVEIEGKDRVKRERDGDEKQVVIPSNQYTQMEANFSLFFGLAIQTYEQTLVANDSLVDKYFDGTATLSPDQAAGLAIFTGPGKCMNCHGGPETTNASVRNVSNERLERMRMGDGSVAVYDDGFYNIGVRPTREDVGIGGPDLWGKPLSEAALCQQQLATCSPDVLNIAGRPDEQIDPAPLGASDRIAVNGSFKVPGLRNVELTGPYFHNGSKATLRQVVDFYARGGDFPNNPDLDTDIAPIMITEPDGTTRPISDPEKDQLVQFLMAFTDDRVRYEKAPFDHPQLCVPNGEEGNTTAVKRDSDSLQAKDSMLCLPAVGAGGHAAALKPFLGLNPRSP